MRLELLDVSRQRTQSDDEISFREQRNLFTLFCSIRRPYITFKLPRGDMDTPPQFLPISGDQGVSLPPSLEWRVWSSSSGNNYHAAHRSLSSRAWIFYGTVRIFFTLSHILLEQSWKSLFRNMSSHKGSVPSSKAWFHNIWLTISKC